MTHLTKRPFIIGTLLSTLARKATLDPMLSGTKPSDDCYTHQQALKVCLTKRFKNGNEPCNFQWHEVQWERRTLATWSNMRFPCWFDKALTTVCLMGTYPPQERTAPITKLRQFENFTPNLPIRCMEAKFSQLLQFYHWPKLRHQTDEATNGSISRHWAGR